MKAYFFIQGQPQLFCAKYLFGETNIPYNFILRLTCRRLKFVDNRSIGFKSILEAYPNAPIYVFPDPGEGGHTRAFDSSSQPVGRDFDFILHHRAPQGQAI